ncbi:hypothetical protein [Limibacillus halophilus]
MTRVFAANTIQAPGILFAEVSLASVDQDNFETATWPPTPRSLSTFQSPPRGSVTSSTRSR